MTENELARLFASIRAFGWNPKKRESTLRNRKIDFEDARSVFDGYILARRSDRHGEARYQVFGYVNGREVSVACALRGDLCWIISARRASRKERREYYHRLPGRPPKGKN